MTTRAKSLAAQLEVRAASLPHRPFLIQPSLDVRLSYAEVWQIAQRLAALLMHHKIGRKATVALVATHHWLFFPLLIACNLRQATLIPLDPRLHADKLADILGGAAPSLVIFEDGASLPPFASKRDPRSCSEILAELEGVETSVRTRKDLDADAADASLLLIYTSGTSGQSKAVMLTAANLLADAAALVTRYAIQPEDRFLCILPTYHMNAVMMTGLVPMFAGASTVLADVLSFKNAKRYWRDCAALECTVLSLVPSVMALLLKLFRGGPDAELPRVRFGFCGAAPLSASLWESFEDRFGVPIYQGYGLTETTCWAVSTPLDGPRRYDTVGRVLPEVAEVMIDPHVSGAAVFSVPGITIPTDRQVGEVLIRGAVLAPGYYRDPKLTRAQRNADGFYKTGDLGFLDADGYLHITGRLKDIIIRNGVNIASSEVDAMMLGHTALEEVKTIGMPDALVGERVIVCAALKDHKSVTADDLRRWAHERLSPHARPDAVEILGGLPRHPTGKISMPMLRGILSGTLSDDIFSSLARWRHGRAPALRPRRHPNAYPGVTPLWEAP